MNRIPGTLLGGKVTYAQPATGFRTGIEPVLLAAAIPARAGETVLEAGTGAGAGMLCLAARVEGVACVGVERNPALAALARDNAAANGFGRLRVEEADILDCRFEHLFDHGFTNPPWHDAAATASPDPLRRASKQASAGLLADWVRRIAICLRPRGTLTVILPASSLADGVVALSQAACGEMRLLPLWPKAGKAAKIVILQGVRGGSGACVVSAGLVLHESGGEFTDATQSILRSGVRLDVHVRQEGGP